MFWSIRQILCGLTATSAPVRHLLDGATGNGTLQLCCGQDESQKMNRLWGSLRQPGDWWWFFHRVSPVLGNPDSKHFRHQNTSDNWCRGHRMSHTTVWVTASNAGIPCLVSVQDIRQTLLLFSVLDRLFRVVNRAVKPPSVTSLLFVILVTFTEVDFNAPFSASEHNKHFKPPCRTSCPYVIISLLQAN